LIGQPFRQPWGAQWSTTVVALVDHDADNGRGAGILGVDDDDPISRVPRTRPPL
jgi:hypothetical protein